MPSAITEGLRRRGVEILTAQEVGLREAPDGVLLAECRSQGWVLLTQDAGFVERDARGEPHAGIIFAYQRRGGIGDLIASVSVLAEFDASDWFGNLEYV